VRFANGNLLLRPARRVSATRLVPQPFLGSSGQRRQNRDSQQADDPHRTVDIHFPCLLLFPLVAPWSAVEFSYSVAATREENVG
jgi:hypothetical protein